MTTTEQRLRAALERAVAIVEANPLSYNPEGRLYRIGDVAREALAAAPEDEGWVRVPFPPTPEMIDAGAQRLASFEDGSVWPDSWDALQIFTMRNEAERVLRSGLLAATPSLDLHEEGKR